MEMLSYLEQTEHSAVGNAQLAPVGSPVRM